MSESRVSLMINQLEYQAGAQPCACFSARDEHLEFPENGRQCPGCHGRVLLCQSCKKDHHSGGWDTCTNHDSRRISLDKLRVGLYQLTGVLNVLDDSALRAQLPGVRRVISRHRKDAWEILGWLGTRASEIIAWLGTPIANTNTNSNSEREEASRNTNSSSNGEEEPTNTQYEEQAL